MPAATAVVDYAGDTVPVIIDRADRQDATGADFCRRARRLQFHLRRGELEPSARRLDRGPYPCVRGDRRRAEAAGAGQHKVAVIKVCLYEPQVNRTYADMAAHYDTAILPATALTSRATDTMRIGCGDRLVFKRGD